MSNMDNAVMEKSSAISSAKVKELYINRMDKIIENLDIIKNLLIMQHELSKETNVSLNKINTKAKKTMDYLNEKYSTYQ